MVHVRKIIDLLGECRGGRGKGVQLNLLVEFVRLAILFIIKYNVYRDVKPTVLVVVDHYKKRR